MIKGRRLHDMMWSKSVNYRIIYTEKRIRDSLKMLIKHKPLRFNTEGILRVEDTIRKVLDD